MTNRKRILLFCFGLALGAFAVHAFAAQGGEGSNTGCNGVGNPNSPCQPGGPNVPPPYQPPVYPPELPPIVVRTPPINNEVVNNNNPINSNANVGINENSNTNNNSAAGIGVGNASSSSSATGGNGGNGGAGGNSNVGISLGVGATAGGGSARAENTSVNTAHNSGNASNIISYEGDEAQKRNPVSTAVAPTVITGSDQCLVPVSFGIQGIGFGVSTGSAVEDKNCQVLKLARLLEHLSGKDAAVQLLRMSDERVDAALKALGK